MIKVFIKQLSRINNIKVYVYMDICCHAGFGPASRGEGLIERSLGAQ